MKEIDLVNPKVDNDFPNSLNEPNIGSNEETTESLFGWLTNRD